MVIDGSSFQGSDLFVARFEGERILIPPRFAQQAGLAGTGKIDCWLLVIVPGRFRLLTSSMSGASRGLSRILERMEEVGEPGDVLDWTESNARAAVRARLIPCVATPPRPGWRINFPKEAKELVPQKEDRSFVFGFMIAGFVELWFPDTLRRAVSVRISSILP
jgi:hypothetical protein